MELVAGVWRVGYPLLVVVLSAVVLVSAVLDRGKPSRISRRFGWIAGIVWLKLAGEAALGDQRPAFERQWKGLAALLLALAAVTYLAKHYRRRRRAEHPEPLPDMLQVYRVRDGRIAELWALFLATTRRLAQPRRNRESRR